MRAHAMSVVFSVSCSLLSFLPVFPDLQRCSMALARTCKYPHTAHGCIGCPSDGFSRFRHFWRASECCPRTTRVVEGLRAGLAWPGPRDSLLAG